MIIAVKGKRYEIPPGYLLLEWVGEKSPLDHEWVRYKLAISGFSVAQATEIRKVAKSCVVRADGVTRRIMKKGNGHGEIPHLSTEKITWGNKRGAAIGTPGSYIQTVTNRDADLILQSESGHEFVAYTEDNVQHQGEVSSLILVPDLNVKIVNELVLRVGSRNWLERP